MDASQQDKQEQGCINAALYMTVADAAARLNMHRNNVYEAMDKGDIREATILGKRACLIEDVEKYSPRAYLETRKVDRPEPDPAQPKRGRGRPPKTPPVDSRAEEKEPGQ